MDGDNNEVSKFVRNLHEMVSEEKNASAIGFSPDGQSLELRDPDILTQVVLPKYFKHGHISSLTRQLNNYGFKTNPSRTNSNVSQSFSHPYFVFGKPHLYLHVKRRSKTAAAAAATTTHQDYVNEETKYLRLDTESDSKPQMSYQELLLLNTQLQAQNAMLEQRIKQLEQQQQSRNGFSQLPPPPPVPMPFRNNNNNSMRSSGEQAMRMFAPVTNSPKHFQRQQQQQHLMRQSGEQARSLFEEDDDGDDDVNLLRNLLFRASMEDQGDDGTLL